MLLKDSVNTRLAEIELHIVDLCEKYKSDIRNINFSTKKLPLTRVVSNLSANKDVLVVSFDLLITEDQKDSIKYLLVELEDYLQEEVTFYMLSGNYYIINN